MNSEPLFSLSDVSFAYPGGKELLKSATFSLDGSSLKLLSGENGCGKSTLLKLLCGDLKPGSGELLWAGKPLPKDRTAFYRQIWHLEQEAARHRIGICPRHDLEVWDMALDQKTDPKRWIDAARRFELDPARLDLPYHRLSTGEARAAALLHLPRLKGHFWLLDEPLAGLDTFRASRVVQFIAEKLIGGVGALVVTHDPEAFRDLPHRHYELRDGKLMELA